MTKEKHFYLIRGLIREKGHWGEFISHLKSSFPTATITTIDIPGAGDYHTSPSPLSIKGMVEGMRRDYLLHQRSNEEAHLIAISLGGMIAVEWMRNHPQDFCCATLINTSFGGISPFFHRLLPTALLHLLKVPLLKGREKESRILELVTNHKHLFEDTLNLWEAIHKERPVSFKNGMKQLFAAASFNVGAFKPMIPILLLVSTNDRMVSAECSRAIARKWSIPIQEHPTGGHDLTVDDPEWVVNQLKKSISEL